MAVLVDQRHSGGNHLRTDLRNHWCADLGSSQQDLKGERRQAGATMSDNLFGFYGPRCHSHIWDSVHNEYPQDMGKRITVAMGVQQSVSCIGDLTTVGLGGAIMG